MLRISILLALLASLHAASFEGLINGRPFYLPDTSRPVQGALVTQDYQTHPTWRELANRRNLVMFPMDTGWSDSDTVFVGYAQNILDTLAQAATQFDKPEIRHTGIVLEGLSANAAVANGISRMTSLSNRVIAVVDFHYLPLGNTRGMPPRGVPQLFVCSQDDSLAPPTSMQGVPAEATGGRPISCVEVIGGGHSDLGDQSYTTLWLEEVMKIRLPATAPTTAPIALASMENADGWVGFFTLSDTTSGGLFGIGKYMANPRIQSKSSYSGSEKWVWLPTQRSAEAWQTFCWAQTITPLVPAVSAPGDLTAGVDRRSYATGSNTALPDFNSMTPVSTAVDTWFNLPGNFFDAPGSWQWDCYINLPVTGGYAFKTDIGPARIILDGQVLAEKNGWFVLGKAAMQAGWHRLTLQISHQDGYPPVHSVTWEYAGQTAQMIPATALKRSPSGGAGGSPSVTLSAPAAGTIFPSGATITLQANASAPAGSTISSVEFLQGTTVLGQDSSSPYSFSWANVSPSGLTNYSLSARVTDSQGRISTSVPYGIYVQGLPLPAPWNHQDVGSPSRMGDATINAASFLVSGSGTDIGGTSDQGHVVYQPIVGDVSITARIVHVESVDPWSKAGLIIRAGLSPDAANVFLCLSTNNGIRFQQRPSAGADTVTVASAASGEPVWLRLQRQGNQFSAWRSDDGAAWTSVGSVDVALPGSVLVGVAATSHNVSVTNNSRIDDIVISGGSKPGDADGNGSVDAADRTIVQQQFGRSSTDAGWDARADLDANLRVDAADLGIVTRHQGD